MFGKKKKETKTLPGNLGEVVEAQEGDKDRTIRVTVFPKEGGRPYFADVEIDEDGTFEIEKDEGTYVLQRGSVWSEDGILRAVVNEGNAQTINCHTLTGDDDMNPLVLHSVANNNLWVQLDSVRRAKSPWKSAGTWGMILIGVGIILMLLWQIQTIGSGMEDLQHAIDNIDFPSGDGKTPAETAREQAGHQNIAPGPGG